MDKVIPSAAEAVADIPDGSVIGIGGFFTAGVPRTLIQALIAKGTKGLTLVCGAGPLVGAHEELVQLVKQGQIKKVIDSYGLFRSASKGLQDPFEQEVRKGNIELEVFPLGTIAERLRAAGAGIPAFYTPTGVGSVVEETIVTNIVANRAKKETRVFNGQKYILEYALPLDYALVHACQGDREGNLCYRMTARNFNPAMAVAGKVTIAEVEHLVEPGEINPNNVHTPGIYIKRMVQVPRTKVRIGID